MKSHLISTSVRFINRRSGISKMEFMRQLDEFVWCKSEWKYPTMSTETTDLLKQCAALPPANLSIEVDDIIKKSKAFPIKFPIQTVRMETLKKNRPPERLKQNVISTYPFIHERVLMLMTHFLIYKREFGSMIEKPFYKDMTVPQLIDRILTKRAVSFMYPEDQYKLLSGDTGEDGWEEVGTLEEKEPLFLENCLSYDEIKLSALVYISGYTECINEGSRHNSGVVREDDAEQNALIIGLIGPRFERLNRMDYEDIIISEKQNVLENGYGENATPVRFSHLLNKTLERSDQNANGLDRQMWRQLWAEFYEVSNFTHEELSNKIIDYKSIERQYKERLIKLSMERNCELFDNEVYYKRLLILVESALLEAEWRAKERGKTAFLNVVGCGLGVWKISLHQTDVFVLTFLERIHAFLETNMLNHVSDVNFAYLRPTQGVLEMFNIINITEIPRKLFFENKQHPMGGINVQLENREPASKLTGEHEGKLLVLTYPWDGNAHPGNEFWLGYLTGSGDPAAACSTQVSELHNAHINAAVSSNNVRVAGRHGVERMSEYCASLPST